MLKDSFKFQYASITTTKEEDIPIVNPGFKFQYASITTREKIMGETKDSKFKFQYASITTYTECEEKEAER